MTRRPRERLSPQPTKRGAAQWCCLSFLLLFTADLVVPAAVLAGLMALHVHFVRIPRARLAITAGRLAGHGRSRG